MLTPVQTELERELATLRRRHSAIDAHLHNADRELPQDFADQATVTGNDQVLEGIDDVTLQRIAAIQQALKRIEDGTYGRCARCGDDIAPRRLAALNTTSVCVGCAA